MLCTVSCDALVNKANKFIVTECTCAHSTGRELTKNK